MANAENYFESSFHKEYVGGDGPIIIGPLILEQTQVIPQTIEEIRTQYRRYVGDPTAELPEDVLEDLKKLGKI